MSACPAVSRRNALAPSTTALERAQGVGAIESPHTPVKSCLFFAVAVALDQGKASVPP